MIVGPEKLAYVFECRRVEIRGLTDGHPVIRVIGREHRRNDRHGGEAIRPVFVVLPALVQHDLALRFELLRGQSRQQVSHPVRFHPEREIERVGGHDLPVVRAIRIGRPIQRGAGFLQRMEISLVVVLRAFEHQMFEQMGEPGPPGMFVLRPDVIPDVHGDHRQPVVFVDDHPKTVFKRVLREGNVHEIGVTGIGALL